MSTSLTDAQALAFLISQFPFPLTEEFISQLELALNRSPTYKAQAFSLRRITQE